MAIITISRQIGSLGDEIAQSAANRLGYEYIEKLQISAVLTGLGFAVSEIDKFDEKKPSVWQTLSIQTKLFAHFIRATVYDLAAKGNVVIVGRGGQVILEDIPGAVHVRIIAPYATRVSRLMELKGYEEKDAQRFIRQSDRDSSGYFSTYFDANLDDSDLYDLVVNTRTMTPDVCVEMIRKAVGTEEIKKSPQMSAILNDLALTHKAKATLLDVVGRELGDLVVKKGMALVSGFVGSPAEREDCERAILSIEGITSIDNQINVPPDNTRIF